MLTKSRDDITNNINNKITESITIQQNSLTNIANINENKLESDVVPHCDTIKIMEQMDKIRGIIGLKYPFDEA